MKQYFEQQLKDAKPVTQDVINKMRQNRIDMLNPIDARDTNKTTPKSSYGTTIEVGDTILYFIVENLAKERLDIKSILLREIDKLDNYEFLRMDNMTPFFKEK